MTLLMLLTLLVFTIATGGSSDDCSATYRHEFEELEQGLETRISGMETSLLGLDNKLNLIIGKSVRICDTKHSNRTKVVSESAFFL